MAASAAPVRARGDEEEDVVGGAGGGGGQGCAREGSNGVGGVQAGHDGPAVGVLAADRRGVDGDVQHSVGEAEDQGCREKSGQGVALAEDGEAACQANGPAGQQEGHAVRAGEAAACLESGDHDERGGQHHQRQLGGGRSAPRWIDGIRAPQTAITTPRPR